jgi:D-lyxose ketol-isomerase
MINLRKNHFFVGLVFVFTLAINTAFANTPSADKQSINFPNSYYYDAKGNFVEERAKDAIIAMLEYHGYSMFDGLRDKIFATDYNSGQFAQVGLSGIMYENNQTNLYMLLDIFLLPNQMLAEHWHVDGETTAAKREGWLVRWGKSYIAGVGVDNMSEFPEIKIPEVHWDGKVEAKHIILAKPGDFLNLTEVLSRHWQMAGDEGAIITEVANFADGAAVKRSDPKMN